MDFRNFRLGVVVRTILLGITIFAAIYAYNQKEWYVTTIVSILFSVLFLTEIIRYAERYKRGLSEFLLSIKSRDFISSASAITDKKSKDTLKEAYREIMNEFQNIRIDKEVQYHYLKTMVEHIRMALLSFDEHGKIEFINKRASYLLSLKEQQNMNQIKNIDISLFHLIQKLKSDESELIKVKIHDELLHLSVYATELKIQKKKIKLISLQNIKQELEYQELESWQKLIRVLTHEIMNSVTPISSLSNSINETLAATNGNISELQNITEDDFEDMISSLQTIETRSKGLLKFVSSYKQLTRIPKPDFKEVNLVELINHCHTLLKQKMAESHIHFQRISSDNEIVTHADYDQIEQVIINLLINAIDTLKDHEKPEIKVKIIATPSNKHKIIISDNGRGIDPENLDKIFIPFFTTKKEGSGIGLSLSRQIMRLHKGAIHVNSALNKGTEFILEF
jgi:nitrogen fixation/metabolism regulation signal transduction histidine kinase